MVRTYGHILCFIDSDDSVFEVSPNAAMAMYPEYWDIPVDNSSAHFDYDQWLERLAPHEPVSQYRHNVGEDNADAH